MLIMDIVMAFILVIGFAGTAYFFLRHINTTGRHIPYKSGKKPVEKLPDDL